MEVKRISANDTYQIRQMMLRQGKPITSCHFDSDEDEQTFHLGAFTDGKLVSVASFFFKNNNSFEIENQYQLRGMATLENFQRKGLSRELLNVAFPVIKQNFCDLLWCNARIEARPFYETVGFKAVGEVFEIEGVGPHILMQKEIS